MRWLLDTCVLSEFARPEPEPRVVEWLGRQAEDDSALSVLTVGEIERGVERLPEGARKRRLEAWLAAEVAGRFEDRLLPVDAAVARAWGRLCARAEALGRPISAVDGLIAATAQVHRLTLVTRNEADFGAAEAPLLNPWKA